MFNFYFAFYLLFTIYYSLFTNYYSLFTIHQPTDTYGYIVIRAIKVIQLCRDVYVTNQKGWW